MKTCSKCRQEKSLSEFNKATNRRDGVQTYCKLCQRGIDKLFYQNNPGRRTRETKEKARDAARRYVLAYLLAHPCVDCGEDDVVVLDFDHLDDKLYHITEMIRDGFSIKRIQEEIDKCEVRCANCHRRATARRHGGWWKVVLQDIGVSPSGKAAASKPAITGVRISPPLLEQPNTPIAQR